MRRAHPPGCALDLRREVAADDIDRRGDGHAGGADGGRAARVELLAEEPEQPRGTKAKGAREAQSAKARALRRPARQREREPRVLVYDPTGYARLVQPSRAGHARVMEIAEEMVSLAASAPAPAPGEPRPEARDR